MVHQGRSKDSHGQWDLQLQLRLRGHSPGHCGSTSVGKEAVSGTWNAVDNNNGRMNDVMVEDMNHNMGMDLAPIFL